MSCCECSEALACRIRTRNLPERSDSEGEINPVCAKRGGYRYTHAGVSRRVSVGATSAKQTGRTFFGDMMNRAVVQPSLESAVLSDKTPRPLSRSIVLGALVCILLLYAYPYWLAYTHLSTWPVPPVFAPDLYFYLGLSHIPAPVGGWMHNTWYGIDIPTAQFGHGRFHLAFSTYARWRAIIGHETTAFVLWMLAWTALIAGSALWLVRTALPKCTTALVVFALAMLMLFDFNYAQTILLNWITLHPWAVSGERIAPFIRAFFPQVSIPLVLGYLGLQILALREGHNGKGWTAWAMMAVFQFLLLCAFPYAQIILAVTTGVLLLAVITRRISGSIPQFLVFGTVCGIVDLGWMLVTGGASPVAGQGSLLAPDLLFFKRMLFSKTALMLLIAVAATVLVCRRGVPKDSKWTITGFGFAVFVLSLSDGMISRAAQASHHILYLAHTAMALLTVLIVAALLSRYERSRIAQLAVLAITTVLFINAAVTTVVFSRSFLELNRDRYAAAQAIESASLRAGDLVLADGEQVDSPAALVPILSPATVLYYKNAELMLPRQYEQQARLRLAAYLYAIGTDHVSVGEILSAKGSPAEQYRIVPVGDRMEAFGPEPAATLASFRSELVPAMIEVEEGTPEVCAFFAQFPRVVVIDSAVHPIFRPDRLALYLHQGESTTTGTYRYTMYTPQTGEQGHSATAPGDPDKRGNDSR